LKIIILTTKTEHHDYFIDKLDLEDNNIFIIYEKKETKFNYKVNHKFYKIRQKVEKNFFQNKKKNREIKKKYFFDINSKLSMAYIKKINPNIIISFGTGLIKKKFLTQFKKKILLNFHGGNPELYRGLDSHLWSIYHKDFNNLVTTLHKIDSKFDTGDILYSKKIKHTNRINIENLRIFNTEICIKLSNKLIHAVKNKKKLVYKKQKTLGRYYSAIPSVLIDNCRKNFQNWINKKKK